VAYIDRAGTIDYCNRGEGSVGQSYWWWKWREDHKAEEVRKRWWRLEREGNLMDLLLLLVLVVPMGTFFDRKGDPDDDNGAFKTRRA
jgi:hypothetical protein